MGQNYRRDFLKLSGTTALTATAGCLGSTDSSYEWTFATPTAGDFRYNIVAENFGGELGNVAGDTFEIDLAW